jgi:hypothetical protein
MRTKRPKTQFFDKGIRTEAIRTLGCWWGRESPFNLFYSMGCDSLASPVTNVLRIESLVASVLQNGRVLSMCPFNNFPTIWYSIRFCPTTWAVSHYLCPLHENPEDVLQYGLCLLGLKSCWFLLLFWLFLPTEVLLQQLTTFFHLYSRNLI